MSSQNLNARLKRIEADAAIPDAATPVLLIPDNGTSAVSPEDIQRRWDEYCATGKTHGSVVIMPNEQADGTRTEQPADSQDGGHALSRSEPNPGSEH